MDDPWYRNFGPTMAGGRIYITTRPVRVGDLTIPEATLFDVSVPFLLRWWISPRDERYFLAAVAHDHALRSGWGRVKAAVPFSEGLRRSGVGKWQRLLMVLAVIVWKWR